MIALKILALYCSKAKENDPRELDSLCQDVCSYIIAKYSFIHECIYVGMKNVDLIIKKETRREKVRRILWEFLPKPAICFDRENNVEAITVQLFHSFLTNFREDRIIGITNVFIHDGERYFAGLQVPLDQIKVVESMVYWKRYLVIRHQFSQDSLAKIVSKSCVHEALESYGFAHHAEPKGCIMDVTVDALCRSETLCKNCTRKLMELV